jgi:hypothetical protein
MKFVSLLSAFCCYLHLLQAKTWEPPRRRLIGNTSCEDGSEPFVHYFEIEIEIEIEIEEDTEDKCSLADQIKLGLDINVALSSQVRESS